MSTKNAWKTPVAGPGIIGNGQPAAIPRPNPCRDLTEPAPRLRRCACGATGYGGQFVLEHARENCGNFCVEVCE